MPVSLCGFVVLWLTREDLMTRLQTLAFTLMGATVETVDIRWLHGWEYRLGNFPAWLVPSYVALFLAAVVMARNLPHGRGPQPLSVSRS